jgi:hypothetical protein
LFVPVEGRKPVRRNRISSTRSRLVQTRVSKKAMLALERQAEVEGTTTAAILRHLVEAHVTEGRSFYERVRAIEVALVNFGVVPEGVTQPTKAEFERFLKNSGGKERR